VTQSPELAFQMASGYLVLALLGLALLGLALLGLALVGLALVELVSVATVWVVAPELALVAPASPVLELLVLVLLGQALGEQT
jgi:hypothetical protein